MRALVLSLAGVMAVGVVGVLGYVVWQSQRGAAPAAPRDLDLSLEGGAPGDAARASAEGDVISLVESSEDGRIPLYDEAGNLTQVLLYERFEPLEGGRFRVERPRALVYLAGDRTAEIRAETAEFTRRQSQREPEQGRFRGSVAVRVYDATVDADAPEEGLISSMAMYTEALDFDTVIGEVRIEEDVRIEAERMRFAGRGATVVFSQRDRRLLFFRLEESDGLTLLEGAAGTTGSDAAQEDEGARAQADDVAAGVETAYRAEFRGPVRVRSEGRTIDAERMEAWVRLVDGALREGAITELTLPMEEGAASAPSAQSALPPHSQEAPGVAASAPAVGTGTMRLEWDGPLEVRPADATAAELLSDDVLVRLSSPSSALVSMQDGESGATLECVALDYAATRGSVAMTGVGPRSVRARLDGRGEAEAGRIEIDVARGVLAIPGPGVLRSLEGEEDPFGSRGLRAERARDVTWQGRGEVRLLRGAGGDVAVREASFFDGVEVRDADARARGEALEAAFFGGEGEEDGGGIRSVSLRGEAAVESGQDGVIEADRLEVLFERDAAGGGSSRPRLATAAGTVRARRGTDTLEAELAEAALSEDAEGRTRIETFTASLGVVVGLGEGEERVTARADRVRAMPLEDVAELEGQPAVIERAGARLSSGSIRLDGSARRVDAFGAGVAERTAPREVVEAGGALAYEHVAVSWSGAMTYDDAAGRAECSGDVLAMGTRGETIQDTARGERLVVEFERSEGESARERVQALKTITLRGAREETGEGKEAEIEARRYEVDATSETGRRLVTLAYLTGAQVIADAQAETVITPGAGRLLIEDRRVSGEQAEELAATGTTVFEWAGSLELNRATSVARMENGVRLMQRPLGSEEIAELECESLEAVFSEVEERLLRAEATGAVFVRRESRQMTADRVVYDALSGVALADAWDENMVTLVDEATGQTQSAGSIEWDLVRDRVEVKRAGPIRGPR